MTLFAASSMLWPVLASRAIQTGTNSCKTIDEECGFGTLPPQKKHGALGTLSDSSGADLLLPILSVSHATGGGQGPSPIVAQELPGATSC